MTAQLINFVIDDNVVNKNRARNLCIMENLFFSYEMRYRWQTVI